MSDGRQYLDGVYPSVMGSSYGPQIRVISVHLQLTGCRLSALVLTLSRGLIPTPGTGDLFVWDWRTGKRYLVSHPISPLGMSEAHGHIKGTSSRTTCDP